MTTRTTRIRKPASPTSRTGKSSNSCFTRTSTYPDVAKLCARIPQAIRQRLGKTERDLGADLWVQSNHFNQVGVKKPDEDGSLRGYRCGGPRHVTKQCHFSEEVAWLEFGEGNSTLRPMLEN